METPERHRPKKFWGQHFLRDANLARKIVRSVTVPSPRLVVEIGPGEGILTERLLATCEHYVGVEIDRDLADRLEQRFGHLSHFRLLVQDVLEVSFTELVRQAGLPNAALVGNLPYNITSPILFKLFEANPPFQQAVFMVQKEVAQRMVAPPGNKTYGLLSVYCRLFARVELLFTVPPAVFFPPPQVQSAVVRLNFPSPLAARIQNRTLLDRVLHQAFQHRRKMLRNSLSPLLPSRLLSKLNIDLRLRPEQLSVEQWLDLTEQIQQLKNLDQGNGANSLSD
ncbi:MAG: ribosomal RNA small subunit methyltransferase A [Calditrichaeota bacterium]|nr:MAG: ribosomal RNA small subunit methyltransferase A [Calditrichota bacterium]